MSSTGPQTIKTVSPWTMYAAVKGTKTGAEKDALVVQLIVSSLKFALSGKPALDAGQEQCELLQKWCQPPLYYTQGQSVLIQALLQIEGITKVCVLTREPVFDLYVVGTRSDLQVYDEISERVVAYKYDNQCSAAYMYMTEDEYAACNTRGIIQVFHRS